MTSSLVSSMGELLSSDNVRDLLDSITRKVWSSPDGRHSLWVALWGVPLVMGGYLWWRRPARFPPGPRGVPGLGVVPFLDVMAARSFARWSWQRYGPVMCVRMGGNDLVIINDADVIKKAFANGGALSGRPAIELLGELSGGRGIFFVDDSPMLWEQRKFSMTVLRKMGMGRAEMDAKVLAESVKLVEKMASYESRPFDVLYLMTNAVSNNVCVTSFGVRFEYDDETFRQVLVKFCRAWYEKRAAFAVLAALCYPPLAKLPGFSRHVTELKRDTADCLDVLRGIIKTKKESFDDFENPKDLCEYYFVEQRKTDSKHFTDEQLLLVVKDMMFGGTITTTSTIRWIIYCLIKYPEMQKRCYQEITENIAGDDVDSSMKSQLPFTYAFIIECMRRHTAVPLGVPHASNSSDVTIGDYVIPKGTPVFSNTYACHMDPRRWNSPERFDPTRHLDAGSGSFVTPTSFLPFGLASRRCAGEGLAMSEIFIYVVQMIRHFRITSPEPLPSPDQAVFGLLNIPPPFRMVAAQR